LPAGQQDNFIYKERFVNYLWPGCHRCCGGLMSSPGTGVPGSVSPYVSCKFPLMSRFIIILIFSFLFTACKDAKFDSIDFIAYRYRRVASCSPDFEEEYLMICPYYLHIDNRYNCQLIKGQTFADSSTYYFESKNDPELKAIIQEIINKFQHLGIETDFRPPIKNFALYDGSYLTIRIIKDDISKIIHFWEEQDSCQSFEKLFFYSVKLFENGIETTMDTVAVKRKQEFVNFVTKSDSILRPHPPLPPRGYKPKYTPPIIVG
jgi:hypothetical protein